MELLSVRMIAVGLNIVLVVIVKYSWIYEKVLRCVGVFDSRYVWKLFHSLLVPLGSPEI